MIEFIGEGHLDHAIVLMESFSEINPFVKDEMGKNALNFVLAKARKNKDRGGENQFPIFKKILLNSEIYNHINDKDNHGNTALHISCARRDFDYIKLLIENGASIEKSNNNNRTPIEVLSSSEAERLIIISNILTSDDNKPQSLNDAENMIKLLGVAQFPAYIFNCDAKNLLNKISNLAGSSLSRNLNYEISKESKDR